jgi:hypothetical protein
MLKVLTGRFLTPSVGCSRSGGVVEEAVGMGMEMGLGLGQKALVVKQEKWGMQGREVWGICLWRLKWARLVQ